MYPKYWDVFLTNCHISSGSPVERSKIGKKCCFNKGVEIICYNNMDKYDSCGIDMYCTIWFLRQYVLYFYNYFRVDYMVTVGL